MSPKQDPKIAPLCDRNLAGHEVVAATVDLSRDVHLFIDFVQREGLKRSHRGNQIPRGPAQKLARILSWPAEASRVDKQGPGYWSNTVSYVARGLGLIKFDDKGIYAGYSSSEPSFPDNYIEIDQAELAKWYALSPLERERRILAHLVETTRSEFFRHATLIEGHRFDMTGSAAGPASRMKLPAIRRRLLELLAELPAGAWLPMGQFIDLVQMRHKTLILDPGLRGTERPAWQRGKEPQATPNLYWNFREGKLKDPWTRDDQLTESSPDVWRRVDGRYLQYFLQEVPYLCGFVDLALSPAPSRPTDVVPPLQPIHAFRLTPRLGQVVRGDPALAKVEVTVVPNFEVLVVSLSYPAGELVALRPFCKTLKEDPGSHLLRLERTMVVEHAALHPGASLLPLLERLSGRAVPANVVAEIQSWSSHAEKLTLYEGMALVETRGEKELAKSIQKELGTLVIDASQQGFLLAREPDKVIGLLEKRGRVPVAVSHRADRFARCEGALGAAVPEPDTEGAGQDAPSPTPAPVKQRGRPKARGSQRAALLSQEMLGYRSDDIEYLAELHRGLQEKGVVSYLLRAERLLIVAADDRSQVQAVLRCFDNAAADAP